MRHEDILKIERKTIQSCIETLEFIEIKAKEVQEKEAATKKYVLGFAFDVFRESVVLIEKDRPAWQAGKHNGVGGKVELIDETPAHAMVREFREETGCDTTVEDWSYFAVMDCVEDIMGGSSRIYCFRTFLDIDRYNTCSTQESEEVKRFDITDALSVRLIDKVRYLIPLALEEHLNFVSINMQK